MIDSFGLSAIRYEDHPAFAGARFEDSPEIDALAHDVSAALETVRARAALPSTNVGQLLEKKVQPALARLFGALKEKNGGIPVFADFADRLHAVMLSLIAEDFAIFAQRGTHAYIEGSPEADRAARSLHDRGYVLGCLDPKAVARLEELVAPFKETLLRKQAEGHRLRESLVAAEWNAAIQAEFATVFNVPDIVTGLSNYMGTKTRYWTCCFELSVAETSWWKGRYGRADESAATAYYHLDMNSPYPKMLCYLSDVTEANGRTSLLDAPSCDTLLNRIAGRALDKVREDPNRGGVIDMTSLVVGTELGRVCFAALPRAMRCIGHFGNDLLAGSPEERYILDHEVVMTGGPGTFVVFDGARVPHRGGIVKEGQRWAFQVIYHKA